MLSIQEGHIFDYQDVVDDRRRLEGCVAHGRRDRSCGLGDRFACSWGGATEGHGGRPLPAGGVREGARLGQASGSLSRGRVQGDEGCRAGSEVDVPRREEAGRLTAG